MQRLLFIIFSFLISVLIVDAQTEQAIHFKGQVVDNNGKYIPYVNILNLNDKTGIATDYFGEFGFLVNKRDTLLFTAIGYKNARRVIPDTIRTKKYYRLIILRPDTILLKQAVVYPWPADVKLLKMDYLELELPDEKIDLRLPKNFGYVSRTSEGFVGVTMPGPVQLLYDKFSHEAKMQRLHASLVKADHEKAYIVSRVSNELIERVTGLKEPEEIEAFRKFCDLSYHYVLASNEYKIIARLKECFLQYTRDQE